MRESCTGCCGPFAPWWRAHFRTDQAAEPQAARTSSQKRPRPAAGRPPRTAAACSWPAAAPGTRAAGAAARAAAPAPPAPAGPPASRARRGRCAGQQAAVRRTSWPVSNSVGRQALVNQWRTPCCQGQGVRRGVQSRTAGKTARRVPGLRAGAAATHKRASCLCTGLAAARTAGAPVQSVQDAQVAEGDGPRRAGQAQRKHFVHYQVLAAAAGHPLELVPEAALQVAVVYARCHRWCRGAAPERLAPWAATRGQFTETAWLASSGVGVQGGAPEKGATGDRAVLHSRNSHCTSRLYVGNLLLSTEILDAAMSRNASGSKSVFLTDNASLAYRLRFMRSYVPGSFKSA
jgi:hypothetical protein